MNIGDTANLNTNPEHTPETILRLFVYGTLKRGYWNHQRFCAQARKIEPAVVWGRLYRLNAGFPALEVPEGLFFNARRRMLAEHPMETVGAELREKMIRNG